MTAPDAQPCPTVSVVLPVFNAARHLPDLLRALAAQRPEPPREIILVDSMSTDGTAAVAAGYEGQVRYLRQPTAGPAATRNLGLGAAQGEFVAFLDADDLWHPEKLARQMARFQARPDLDLCVTHVRHFWISELSQEAARYRDHPRSRVMPGYYTSTLLAARSLFDIVGEFNSALWHSDATDWFLRAAERRAVMELLPDVLTYHRLHHTNLSRRLAGASRDEYVQLLKATLDRRRRFDEAAAQSREFRDSERGQQGQSPGAGASSHVDY